MPLGLPPGYAPAATCSAKPGAEREPHPPQFWKSQGPVARWEFRPSLRFCAPEILQNLANTRPPVMGVLGDGRHGGRGGAAASADCARPLASFGSFSTWKRNSPRRAKPLRNGAPSRGPGQLLLPLRGNSPSRVLRLESKGTRRWGRAPALQSSSNDACFSDCPLIRPSVRTGAPSPQMGRLLRIIISE